VKGAQRSKAGKRVRLPPLSWQHTLAVCVLALLCTVATYQAAGHVTIVPACTAYARDHGLIFERFTPADYRHETDVECIFRRADGTEHGTLLRELTPFLVGLWACFATDFELTLPAFLGIVAVLWGLMLIRLQRPQRGTSP
jgi:hypothetical protein